MVAAECIKLAGMQEELRGAPLEIDAQSDSSKTKNCESTVCHLENIRPQHHIYLTSSRVAVESRFSTASPPPSPTPIITIPERLSPSLPISAPPELSEPQLDHAFWPDAELTPHPPQSIPLPVDDESPWADIKSSIPHASPAALSL